jgi:hypothetical protein
VINNNVLNGLAAWVVCELITIVVYNYIALKKMRVK